MMGGAFYCKLIVLWVHWGVCYWDELWNLFGLSLFCRQVLFSSTAATTNTTSMKEIWAQNTQRECLSQLKHTDHSMKSQTIITFNPANVANCRGKIWIWPTFGRLLAFLQTSLSGTLQAWRQEQEEKKSDKSSAEWSVMGDKSNGPPPQHHDFSEVWASSGPNVTSILG